MFAGVTIDCFQCHAEKPEKTPLFHPIVTPGMEKVKDVHQAESGTLLNRLAEEENNATGASQ